KRTQTVAIRQLYRLRKRRVTLIESASVQDLNERHDVPTNPRVSRRRPPIPWRPLVEIVNADRSGSSRPPTLPRLPSPRPRLRLSDPRSSPDSPRFVPTSNPGGCD